jgi:hypothetical protein
VSRKPSVQCYLCGKWANSHTRDHVPPKALAGDVPNIEFKTVPACRECNGRFSSEESKFRDFLALIGSNLGVKEADGALEAFRRNVGRRPGPNRDYNRIMNAVSEREIYSGSIYLGTAPTIRVSEDLDVSMVIIKIAQGLHYYYTEQVVPPSYEKMGWLLQPQYVPPQLHQAGYVVVGNVGDFFHYKGWWKMEDSNLAIAIWVMFFYQRAYGIAMFKDPHFIYPIDIADEEVVFTSTDLPVDAEHMTNLPTKESE